MTTANKQTIELSHKDIWGGEYKGVRFEICHWGMGWNYYLFLPLAQIPEDYQKYFNLRGKRKKFSPDSEERIWYEYMDAPILSDLDWHGGITYYEKLGDGHYEKQGVKVGCDYMHFFDEGRSYTLESVRQDAIHTIDKLCEYIPNLKQRCHWNGKYYYPEEGKITEQGSFLSFEGEKQQQMAEREKPIGIEEAGK